MIPDGRYTAVVDRIEDGLATLELEGDDGRFELVVDPAELPPEARRRDAVLDVDVSEEDIVAATFDEEETRTRDEAAQDRFDRLSKRPPSEDNGE